MGKYENQNKKKKKDKGNKDGEMNKLPPIFGLLLSMLSLS